MDFRRVPLFEMINKKMTYLGQRQEVLAQNIANADTPDFKPRDLVPLDFKNALRDRFYRMQPERASQGQSLPGTLPADPKWRNPQSRAVFEQNPNGNGVVLEEQMAKVQETNMEFQASAGIYKKYVQMYKTALRR